MKYKFYKKFFIKFVKRKKNKSSKHVYWTLKHKTDKIFWAAINYQMHNHAGFYFKNKFINFKYLFLLKKIYEDNLVFFSNLKKVSMYFKQAHYKAFFEFAYFYNFLFKKINYDFFILKKKRKKRKNLYNLILTFRKNKLFININNKKKKDYFFLSTGFFIKFFEKKKLYKKSKIIRTLMIKFLRKMFLLLKLPHIILILKKNPIFFLEFLSIFHQPILHKFNEPLTNRLITDDENKPITKILYFVFLNSQNYVNNKTKKKGRVKRKISRKIVLKNNIVD